MLLIDGHLSAEQVGRWLRARSRALDGQRPIELLEHDEDAYATVRKAALSFAYGDPM